MKRKRAWSKGLTSAILGLGAGLLLGLFLFQQQEQQQQQQQPQPLVQSTTSQPAAAAPSRKPGGLLFVGVMTARKYLDTRARAVYESWGREVPGDIGFYSSETSRSDFLGDKLHPLARVDDSYPPQKKSFLMLEHMWREYGDSYEWFLRADDDLYVRMDRLESLLRSVDSRRPLYVGQAGRGNTEEFGLLSLEYDENFCMGGPGVLLSRETLKRLVPHIKYCLGNLYTSHEDVELGRCVRKFAGISCTWSYEMQSILYHNSSADLAFTGRLKTKEVHRAISMHPVKSPRHMYRLHNYVKGLKIQELQNKKLKVERDSEIGSDKPRNKTEVVRIGGSWNFVSRSEYSLSDSNPRRRIHGDLREGLEDGVREVMSTINSCSRQRGRLVEERQALYGYRAHSPDQNSVYTILDLLLIYKKYRGKKVTLPVRRHLYLRQQFTGLEVRELREDKSKVVNFVVPVSGRREALKRFLDNYERICCLNSPDSSHKTCKLMIVHYDEEARDLVGRLSDKYGPDRISLIEGSGKFSRARALDHGARLLEDDDLVFFVDVDISFSGPALDRIIANTQRSKSVYFPVVYSQYDPKVSMRKNQLEIDEESGFWRIFGYGIAAMYKSDYVRVGGFDLGIEGWGKEDVDLFEKILKFEDLTIFRAPDLDLVHVYHGISCQELASTNKRSEQLSMCKGTRADTYASIQLLSSLVLRNPKFLAFAASAMSNQTIPAAV